MPFSAKDKQTGKILYAFNFKTATEIRLDESLKELVCPFCDTKMFPRQGSDINLHFAHTKKCTSKLEGHPETELHLQLKQLIFNKAVEKYSKLKDIEVRIECPLPEVGENGRIADVAVVYKKTGVITVIECQVSRISIVDLKQRIEDYHAAGIDVNWVLGDNAATNEVKSYLLENLGGYKLVSNIETVREIHTTVDF